MARVLVTLGIAIVAGAAALPVTSVGVGWLVSALAALAVVVAARTLRGRLVEYPPTPSAAPPPTAASPTPPTPTAESPTVASPTAASPAAPPPTVPQAEPRALPATQVSSVTHAPVLPVFPPPPPSTAASAPPAVATPPAALEVPGQPAPPAAVVVPGPQTVRTPPEVTPPTLGDRIWRWAAGFAALVLVAVPTVRASGVVAFLCLVAALLLGSYALVGGRTWAAVLFSGLILLPGVVVGVQWLVTHRPRPGRPTWAKAWRVLAAVAATLMLVAVLVPLLRSADPVFAELLDQWTRYLPRLDGRTIVGALVLAFIGIGAAYYAYRGPTPNRSTVEPSRPLTGPEWLLPIGVVNAIFAVFVVVQVNVLFGGHEYVLGAGGPDYADYARGGFGQLVVVTMISLGLAAGLGGLVRRDRVGQRVLVRVMGGLLCGLTLVIVASAIKRMLLYVDVYGFTWLRMLSLAGEVFLGLVIVLLLAAGIRLRGAWLPRATGGAAVAVLLALVAINPEAVMARTGIEARLDSERAVDVRFLDGLSADAVDEILRLPAGARDCALEELRKDLAEPDAWYEFNVARQHAREVLATVRERDCSTDSNRMS